VLQVDDGKSTVGEMRVDPLVAIREPTLFVRTAMVEALAHLLGGHVTIDLLIGACYATHSSDPSRDCNPRGRTLGQRLVHLDVERGLVIPGQLLFDSSTPKVSHFVAPWLVIDEVNQQLRHLADIIRGCVDRGVPGRVSGLAEIESHDREREGHVLHGLVHRRDVI
jgi:hypothetical protein